ncbi:SDR family oxidoreductase [Halalkalibacter alkaliphilus]|uniref:SDR family oxidoreductase n=1 Tax=Halalkalibacter alkaliphilus TaxID=2917993 RepID=A0A9X2I5I8_9BACI|nr:SDR family oxidoreductase [Halalkalibacter alkaliphilus]MCL7748387.1 SDR family oxidoreductase [Halalkalibacter alkaliphilus]
MNIFITGGTGFLGTQFIQELLDSDNRVYVLVRSTKKSQTLLNKIPKHQHSQVEIIEGHLADNHLGISKKDQSNLKGKIDAFFHIAALLSFDFKMADQLYEVNEMGTKHSLELAKNIGVKSYYYISTAYTLGKKNAAEESLHEMDQEFNNPYEETKCKAEHIVMSYSEHMNVSIFRPSIIVGHSVTGKSDSTFGLYGFMKGLEIFKKKVSRAGNDSGKRYNIIGNQSGTQNLVPVDYVCRVLMAGLEKAKNKTIYHVTNPNPPVNHEGLKMIGELLDFPNIQFNSREDTLLTKEEMVLNEFVSNFTIYVNRDIDFSITNTQQLLNATNNQVLNMDNEMLRTIIDGYKKQDKTPVLV